MCLFAAVPPLEGTSTASSLTSVCACDLDRDGQDRKCSGTSAVGRSDVSVCLSIPIRWDVLAGARLLR